MPSSTTKTILTKRYGVDLVRFSHPADCVLFSSRNDANDREWLGRSRGL